MQRYKLEFVVFTTGAVVMILELCGSRILAPFVGVSIVVWTSLIGIILGSLSLGYFLGGRLADQDDGKTLSFIIFLASIFVVMVLILRMPTLKYLDLLYLPLSIKSVLAATILFLIPNILLGMVTPIATKLKMQSLKKAGTVVGNLYALSTIGSIFGTFFAGFILLAFFSVTQIVMGLGFTLFLLSIITQFSIKEVRLLVFIGIMVTSFTINYVSKDNVKVFESRYNHIQVFNSSGKNRTDDIKVLMLDNKLDSAMYLNRTGLVFDYTKYYHLAKSLYPDAKNALMIGGGAYSVPKDFIDKYKDINIDVVELDPFLTEIAHREFSLKSDPRLKIYHEDGREFLNRNASVTDKIYDSILIDAFSSYSIPFHLTTLESIEKMSSLLNKNGIVIVNILSTIEGDGGKFLQAQVATYKKVFPYVYVFAVDDAGKGEIKQNIMLMAMKDNKSFLVEPTLFKNNLWTKPIFDRRILIDDFAPVDQYMVGNF